VLVLALALVVLPSALVTEKIVLVVAWW